MKRALFAIFLLSACAPGLQDELARAAAKSAIQPVLAERFPGIPVQGAADCVIDNASAQEILILAADATTGATASTSEIVGGILSRPATQTCLAREYAGLVLSGI